MRRQFVSPLVSRQKKTQDHVREEGEGSTTQKNLEKDTSSPEKSCSPTNDTKLAALVEERCSLRQQLNKSQEHLRKLHMVKTYRNKVVNL